MGVAVDILFGVALTAPGVLLRWIVNVLFSNVAFVLSTTSHVFVDWISNMLGCFLLGFFEGNAEIITKWHPALRVGLAAGFCGSLTTFSGWLQQLSLVLVSAPGYSGGWPGALFSLFCGTFCFLVAYVLGLDAAAGVLWLRHRRSEAALAAHAVGAVIITPGASLSPLEQQQQQQQQLPALQQQAHPQCMDIHEEEAELHETDENIELPADVVDEILQEEALTSVAAEQTGDMPAAAAVAAAAGLPVESAALHETDENVEVPSPDRQLVALRPKLGLEPESKQPSPPQMTTKKRARLTRQNVLSLAALLLLGATLAGISIGTTLDVTGGYRFLWIGLFFAPFGTVLRILLGRWLNPPSKHRRWFPLGTFTSNMTGCLFIALQAVLAARFPPPSPLLSAAFYVGFYGCLTTVSTFARETVELRAHRPALCSYGYSGATLGGGLLLCALINGVNVAVG